MSRKTTSKAAIANRKFIPLLFFIIATFNGFSQKINTTLLIGKVIDAQTHEAIPGVNIYTKKYGTVSDIDGNFTFKLSPQDTVKFSFVGYENYFFSLGDTIQAAQLEIKISLQHTLKELEEVMVHAFMTEQHFKDAVISYKLPNEKKMKKIAGFYYGPPRAVNPKGFSSPISYLVNKFGKQAKQGRNFEKQKVLIDHQNYLNTKYNKDIVGNITGLYGEELDDFMHFCKLSDALIEEANEYDMTLAITKCFDDFKKNN